MTFTQVCRRCGHQTLTGERFCARCGTPVTATAMDPPPADAPARTVPPPRKMSPIPLVLGLVVLAAVVAGGIYLQIGTKPKVVPSPAPRVSVEPAAVSHSFAPEENRAVLTFDSLPLDKLARTPWWNSLKDAARAQMGVDLDADVLPWMGTSGTIAVLDTQGQRFIIAVAERDALKASEFAGRKIKARQDVQWSEEPYETAALQIPSSSAAPCFSHFNNTLLLARSRDDLKLAIDTWSGKHRPADTGELGRGSPQALLTVQREILEAAAPDGMDPEAKAFLRSLDSVSLSVTSDAAGAVRAQAYLKARPTGRSALASSMFVAPAARAYEAVTFLPADSSVCVMGDLAASPMASLMPLLADGGRKALPWLRPEDFAPYLSGEVGAVMASGVPKDVEAQSQLAACEANLKTVATALDACKVDKGHYPANPGELLPTYLKILPTCPSGNTYQYRMLEDQENYEIVCQGQGHKAAGLPSNKPSYDSIKGLDTGESTDPGEKELRRFPLLVALGITDREKVEQALLKSVQSAAVPVHEDTYKDVKIVEVGGLLQYAIVAKDKYLLVGSGPVRKAMEAAVDAVKDPTKGMAGRAAYKTIQTSYARDMTAAVFVNPQDLLPFVESSLPAKGTPEGDTVRSLLQLREVWVTWSADANAVRVSLYVP